MTTSFIMVDDITVGESAGYADFLVRLDAPNSNPVTVSYRTFNWTAVNGSDYKGQSGTLTFAPGETVKTVRVGVVNDTWVESSENFGFELYAPSNNALISRNVATATIVDNDASANTPLVSVNDFVVDETAKEANFIITLNKPNASVVSLNYTTQNGAALAGSDFVATSGTLSFAPGETAKTVKVTLLNDTIAEISEAFNLVLSGLTNATAADPIGTAIINENDAPGVASSSLLVDDITVGESAGYADFLVRLEAPNANAVTVNYRTFNWTAVNGSDYKGQSGTLTFAPGETVKTVRVSLINDTGVESSENFGFELYGPSNNARISRNVATATIVDNDAPADTPLVSINDFVVDEAAKEANFIITLNKPNASVVSLNYTTQNGSAVAGSDFVATSGTLSFAPGETAKTVKVTLLNDTIAEISEAFNLVLSSLTNATTTDPIGTAIINENDAPAVASSSLLVDDITVGEGNAHADFLVRLDAPNANAVTVNYQTFNWTAVNGSDYKGQSGTLTFVPGETAKTVRVSLINDTGVESSENFGFELYGPSNNARISRNVATATIVDNDAPSGTPVVSVGDTIVDENNGLAYVTLTLNKPGTNNVTVNYSLQNVTTTSGSDFVSFQSQTVNFIPGETAKTIVVGLVDDTVSEANEIFDVALTGVSGATIGDGRGRVIIGNNDATAVSSSTIGVANIAALEGQGYSDFIVQLSAPNTEIVTVNYKTLNSTAINGNDYKGQSGYLTFVPGETTKTVRVSLINNTAVESSENFAFELYSPSTNAVLGNTTATATIIDDDGTFPVTPINITGTARADILRGTELNDALVGGGGNDVLDGAGGNDSMDGGIGNDLYIVEQTGDTVTEAVNAESDTVISYINYTLTANVEALQLGGWTLTGTGNALNNTITGNSGNNTLDGGDGNDTINGGAGNDFLTGASGNDVLVGDAGNDTLTGGTGSDRFLYNTDAAFTSSAVGLDRITDFTLGTDKIVLDKTTFSALTSLAGNGFSTSSEFAIVANDGAAATTGALIAYSSTTGNLFYNQNKTAAGFGSGERFATLTGIPSLTGADFVIQL